jgi:hypothetical protein
MSVDVSVAQHLSDLHAKVEEVAERAGVSAAERRDVETALAALPWRERRRLGLVFESVRAHAGSPALHKAVDVMLALAQDIWARTPPPADPGEGNSLSRPGA